MIYFLFIYYYYEIFSPWQTFLPSYFTHWQKWASILFCSEKEQQYFIWESLPGNLGINKMVTDVDNRVDFGHAQTSAYVILCTCTDVFTCGKLVCMDGIISGCIQNPQNWHHVDPHGYADVGSIIWVVDVVVCMRLGSLIQGGADSTFSFLRWPLKWDTATQQ